MCGVFSLEIFQLLWSEIQIFQSRAGLNQTFLSIFYDDILVFYWVAFLISIYFTLSKRQNMKYVPNIQ